MIKTVARSKRYVETGTEFDNELKGWNDESHE
jgi:hypothetical protein